MIPNWAIYLVLGGGFGLAVGGEHTLGVGMAAFAAAWLMRGRLDFLWFQSRLTKLRADADEAKEKADASVESLEDLWRQS